MSESNSAGQLQDYSVDQAAGAVVLVLGAVASLLLVIWQSKNQKPKPKPKDPEIAEPEPEIIPPRDT